MKKKTQVQVIPKTKEQLLEDIIKDNYRREESIQPPSPTRSFKVGDSVIIGNLEECVIKDVSDCGRYYYVENLQTGRDVPPNTYRTQWWNWYNIYPDSNSPRLFGDRAYLRLQYISSDVGSLIHRAIYFGINENNPVQRDHVWSIDDKVALIDSIFHSRDTGRFVLLKREYPYSDEIIDGKQRLNAILDFYFGKFKYKGLYYHELNRMDRFRFEDHPAPVAEVKGLDEKQIVELFLHINFTGVAQSEEHLSALRKKLEEMQ